MFDQKILLLLGSATALSYGLCHLYRVIAVRHDTLAEVNERSAHDIATPTGSGIVLFSVFFLGLLFLYRWGEIELENLLVCLGPLAVGIIGYIDDRRELSVRVRLPVYITAAIWSIIWIGFPDINLFGLVLDAGLVGLIFGAIALLWLQNLFNFMDGIDGIAASEVLFVCLSAVFITIWLGNTALASNWMLISLTSGAVALGYLFLNWPPAKLFMGDAGSNFFGLMLGILVLCSDFLSVWTWMILLCQFIVDACLTISIRALGRQSIHKSHSQHAYQHLNRKIGSLKTLLLTILINFIWLLPLAALAERFPNTGFGLLLLAALPILVKDWLAGAGRETPGIGISRLGARDKKIDDGKETI